MTGFRKNENVPCLESCKPFEDWSGDFKARESVWTLIHFLIDWTDDWTLILGTEQSPRKIAKFPS